MPTIGGTRPNGAQQPEAEAAERRAPRSTGASTTTLNANNANGAGVLRLPSARRQALLAAGVKERVEAS